MSYTLRVEQAVKDLIASWGIPVPVLRDFYLRAVDSLEGPTARLRLREPSPDELAENYKYVITVDDHARADRHYQFFLSIDIHGHEVWVVQCDCWLVDRDGNVVWSSDGAQ